MENLMKRLTEMTAALLLSAGAMVAFAQTPTSPPADGKAGAGRMRDCSKLEDADKRGHCEKRQAAMKAAREKCKDKPEGPDRHRCMREALPKVTEKK